MATETTVFCKLTDCIYFLSSLGDGKAICSHQDIRLADTERRCPLYRMDWLKKYQPVLNKSN